MASISVGDRTLHLYKGDFLWRDSRPAPSSFRSIASKGSRRRATGSRRASAPSFLPVVVLGKQRSYDKRKNSMENTYGGRAARHVTGGRHDQQRMDDSSVSGSDMYGSSTSGGGCGCGGGGGAGNTNLPVLIAALAASVFFLNNAIIMAGKRRKKRQLQEYGVQNGEEDMGEQILIGKIKFDISGPLLSFNCRKICHKEPNTGLLNKNNFQDLMSLRTK